jgi:hypothetical protein
VVVRLMPRWGAGNAAWPQAARGLQISHFDIDNRWLLNEVGEAVKQAA